MEKRLFLAVALSIGFLWLWSFLVPRLFPDLVKKPVPAAVTSASPAPQAGSTTSASAPASSSAPPAAVPAPPVAASPAVPTTPIEAAAEQLSVIEQPDFVATFSNVGAQLVSFRLTKYAASKGEAVDLVRSRPADRHDYPFAIESSDEALTRRVSSARFKLDDTLQGNIRVLHYTWSAGDGVRVEKTFRISNSYQFDFNITVTGRPVSYRVIMGPGIRTLAADEEENRFVSTGNGLIQHDGSVKVFTREKADKFQTFTDGVDFIGIEDNYFLSVLKPEKGGAAILRSETFPSPKKDEKTRKDLYAGVNAVDGVVAGKAFFGPKKADVLDTYGLEKTLQLGFFGPIAKFLLRALIWIYGVTRNYGWSIIVLTILIKLVLYPLQHKSIVSMKKMQKLQPKVNSIRDRYKKAKTDAEQRQKMNVEMMKLYQQEGVNPMGGCLPIVLQLPILWAFYGLLSHAIELRGAVFIGWITDLSVKDPYYITPILMTITMFVQQWMTPTTVDPAQKKMFMIMPVIFGWIFKEFPSGLVLYWLVQNILTIVQQMIMNRWWKEHPVAMKTKR
jgi:YidC/Oxa1 family membrane protein insertase